MTNSDAQPFYREITQNFVQRHLHLVETVLRGPFDQGQIAARLAVGVEFSQRGGGVKHVAQRIGKPTG